MVIGIVTVCTRDGVSDWQQQYSNTLIEQKSFFSFFLFFFFFGGTEEEQCVSRRRTGSQSDVRKTVSQRLGTAHQRRHQSQ